MKTAAEWRVKAPYWLSLCPDMLIDDIQADARAGMVPAGPASRTVRPEVDLTDDDDDAELDAARGALAFRTAHVRRLEAELADLRCKVEVLENSIRSYELSTGEHEAELAKAWEAGRDAAAVEVDNWNGDGEDNPSRLRATGSIIAELKARVAQREAQMVKASEFSKAFVLKKLARIDALETAMLRLLEAGAVVRQSTYLPRHSLRELQAWDEAARAAEGLVGK